MDESNLEIIKSLAASLSHADKVTLVELLSREMVRESTQSTKPKPLRGAWRDKIPFDAEIETALAGIRREWEEEVSEVLRN